MKHRLVILRRSLPRKRRMPMDLLTQYRRAGFSDDLSARSETIDLNGLLAQAVRQFMDQTLIQSGDCACGLSDKSRSEMAHLVGLLQDVGEGSMARGLECLRETIKSHLTSRRRLDRAVMAAATILIGALTSAGLAALWLGLRHHLAARAVP